MYKNMREVLHTARYVLQNADTVVPGRWQGKENSMEFLELLNVSVNVPMEDTVEEAVNECDPDLPWADDHFEERVSGEPLNPPPSHTSWKTGTNDYLSDTAEDKFSHSYPERMWSKGLHSGIRFDIADLDTLIDVIIKDPGTRQAYLPIFFPEDLTASVEGERVPCTLGWHFIIRKGHLHCHYPMRSCDAVRHFHNDLYLANRLTLYVIHRLKDLGLQDFDGKPLAAGNLFMNITSLHCFKNDMYTLKQMTRRI